jgi:hypothetical protein
VVKVDRPDVIVWPTRREIRNLLCQKGSDDESVHDNRIEEVLLIINNYNTAQLPSIPHDAYRWQTMMIY